MNEHDDKPVSEEAIPVSSGSIEEVPPTPQFVGGFEEADIDVHAGPQAVAVVEEAPAAPAPDAAPAEEDAKPEPPPPPAPSKPVETWARELGTEDWLFAAAKMHAGWPKGREATEAEYKAALEGAANVTSR